MKLVLKALAAGVVAACVGACIPQPPKTAKAPEISESPASAAQAMTDNGCPARASIPWSAGAAGTFTADAFTDGPSCAQAVAILVIRNAAGEVLWTDSFNVPQNMALFGASDAKSMQKALIDWVRQDGPPAASTAALPTWAKGADMPMSGEFPFYLEDGTTREDYAAVREKKLPMFCYVQGIESSACLALEDGAFQKLGAQSFPG